MADGAVRRRDLPAEFHATAPVRLDFAGGWTDVPPFSAREGGVVVNGAIDLTARVAVQLGGRLIRLVAEDLGEELECADSGGLVLDGRLDLLKAALRMLPVQAACTITTRCDAPPGSGLGSSGPWMSRWSRPGAGARGAADRARDRRAGVVPRGRRGEDPGRQAGPVRRGPRGFQRLTFRDPDVGVEPITLDPAFAAGPGAADCAVLYGPVTGVGDTIARVMAAYQRGEPQVTGALRAMKDLAATMAEALRAETPPAWRPCSRRTGRISRRSIPGCARPKWPGSSARCGPQAPSAEGGRVGRRRLHVLYHRDDSAPAIAAARAAGATVLPVRWAAEGVRAW